MLAELTGLVTELAINTRKIRKIMSGLPNCYKVDLACTKRLLAVEVDGSTHRSQLALERDMKKTKALSLLGWSVLRFSNHEVMENTASVVETIQSFMTSK